MIHLGPQCKGKASTGDVFVPHGMMALEKGGTQKWVEEREEGRGGGRRGRCVDGLMAGRLDGRWTDGVTDGYVNGPK